jgi:deoxyribonuclease V
VVLGGVTQHTCAVDVHYDDEQQLAHAAAVVFGQWSDAEAAMVQVHTRAGLEPYVSGELYRRELPVLVDLLALVEQRVTLERVIVDGHVDVAPDQPGLGRHLFEALERRLTVVGVAKNAFVGAPSEGVFRGRSRKPLWVSSTGDLEAAVAGIRAMYGSDRIPKLLRLADRSARQLAARSA